MLIFIFLCSLFSQPSFSEERPGKAVFEISSELGMRIADKALKNIEVKTVEIDTTSDHSVPLSSLVHFQDQVGVYQLRQGWFKLINIQIIKKYGLQAIIRSSELKAKDEIVVSGAELLRVAEMDAFGSGE